MIKRSSITVICFALLMVIGTMNAGLEARNMKKAQGSGKAEDRGAYGEYDTNGAEGDRDITSTGIYTVRSGDTIYSIARKFGVSPDAISDINSIKNGRIIPGMKLKVPVPVSGNKKSSSAGINSKQNKSITGEKKEKDSCRPDFRWPLKSIRSCTRDGDETVKSIGIIIKGNPNADVYASERGTVKKIGYMRGYGRYVVIAHENRYITVYSNLEQILVKEGDSVEKGRLLGRISGDSILHFQIGRAGKPQNPLEFLPRRG